MLHLLSIKDLSKEDIQSIFSFDNIFLNKSSCKSRILATLFFEPSTRTKLSFHTAMYKLGGQVIDLDNNSSLKKGESEADTIKTISQYADILVIRHPETKCIEELVRYSDIPVINAGDGSNEHPTQALIDLYTINQYKNTKNELTIMFTGDLYYGRTIYSLLKIMKHTNYNIKLIFTNEPSFNIKDCGYNSIFIEENLINNYIESVDILYMTRPQKERYKDGYKTIKTNFILTKELVYKMKADAIIMHPLPRNIEIHSDVDQNYRAKYFDQVKNGVKVRTGLIHHMLNS